MSACGLTRAIEPLMSLKMRQKYSSANAQTSTVSLLTSKRTDKTGKGSAIIEKCRLSRAEVWRKQTEMAGLKKSFVFQKSKAYKVKVEAAPGEVGFGRATIVDKMGEKILVQLKTSREANKVLPKGTRMWFVNESSENSFNGMWATSVLGAQLFSGRTALICSAPRLEALLQRRRTPRAALDVNATIRLEGDETSVHLRTQDIFQLRYCSRLASRASRQN